MGYAARLLKKPDRVAALAACAHTRWRRFSKNGFANGAPEASEGQGQGQGQGPAGFGDSAFVSACLAKVLKIADASSKAASLTAGAGAGAGEAAGLWTSALDAHLWFFENGCEGARASAVAELLKRTDEELSALSSRGACPPDVRAHYDATVRHVAHQRERIDAVGERYRELPET